MAQGPCVAIIPARAGSLRLPDKPLRAIAGLPLVEHVRRRCVCAACIDRVVVATDNQRVAEAIRGYGGEVVVTGPCQSGTQRVGVAADLLALSSETRVLNVQGDQPELDSSAVEVVVSLLERGAPIATVAATLPPAIDPARRDVVKVVVDLRGRALYFSRAPIPYGGPWLVHIGVYGFQRSVLSRVAHLPKGVLAQREDLEQLDWLANGLPIEVALVANWREPVDTLEQLMDVRVRVQDRGSADA